MPAEDTARSQHPSIAHLIDLFRHCGIEGEEALSSLAETYERSRKITAPTYVEPGEIDGVDVGLILPQKNKKNAISFYTAIILTRLTDTGRSKGLDHPILRSQPLSNKTPLETPDMRREALRNAVKGWRSGLGGGFSTDPEGYDCPLTNACTAASRIVSRNAQVVSTAIDQEVAKLVGSERPRAFSRKAFRKAIYERELKAQRRQFADTLVAFRQNLDPEILKYARDTGVLTMDAYNLLAGHGDDQSALYRRQAIAAYPVTTLELTDQSMAVHYIDNGWPPAESLVSAWQNIQPQQVTSADPERWSMRNALRYLHGYTCLHTGRQPIESLSAWVGRLSYVPKEWVPSDPKGFDAMRRVVLTADSVSRVTHRDFSELITSTSGDWHNFEQRRPAEPENGLIDMLGRAWDHLVLPEILRRCPTGDGNIETRWRRLDQEPELHDRLTDAILGRHGLLKILRANDRFHRRLPRLNALTRTHANSGISWPALSSEQVFEGVRVVPLTTPEALIEEGDAMQHCVGGYTEICFNGAHVVSLRDDGYRLATAKLDERVVENRQYLSISELRGPSNSPPMEEVEEALKQYVDYLNRPENKPDFAELTAQRNEGKAALQGDRTHLRIGFDYTNSEAQEDVWQEWRSIIPGPARKAHTYEAFLAQTGLDDALQESLDHAFSSASTFEEDIDDALAVMRM